jgi:hypothetical protein
VKNVCRSGNPVCDIDRELLLLLLPHARTQQPNNISQKYKKKKKRRWGDVWPRYILSTVSYLHKRVKLSISLFFLFLFTAAERRKKRKKKELSVIISRNIAGMKLMIPKFGRGVM